MKIKTNEVTNDALDWAVALIENPEWKEQGYLEVFPYDLQFDDGEKYSPSTDWAQGGPIVERENLCISTDPIFQYTAWIYDGLEMTWIQHGPTPLIAAMRCYVASKLGDEVEIPKEMDGFDFQVSGEAKI
jgi:hypothetical protein